MSTTAWARALQIAARVERFVREIVIPYETDPRRTPHGPTADLVTELRSKAREAGVLTPHVLQDGTHLTQRETAIVLAKSGLSQLGPIAVNTSAPDEGNMFLLGKLATCGFITKSHAARGSLNWLPVSPNAIVVRIV